MTNERAPGDGYLVLWVGSTEIAERDTQVELRRAGVRVEIVPPEELVAWANQRAPDLVVLGGELGEEPEEVVQALAATSPGTALPVLALAPSHAAAPRPRARFGLVARFDRELSPAVLAAHVGKLLRGLSSRSPAWRITARATDLAPLAARLASSGRAGLLAAEGGAIAVQAGGPIAPRALLAGPAEAYFYERPSGAIRVLDRASEEDAPPPGLEDVRVLVIDGDVERRERTARHLEQAGAEVRATGLVAQAVHASRVVDPAVVVVAAPALRSAAVAPLWSEPRLVTAPVLVIAEQVADLDAVVRELASLASPARALSTRLRDEEALAERLETLGSARWLKLLGSCPHDVTLRVFGAAGRARIDLSGGRIQGASFRPDSDGAVIDGRAAVDALMAMQFGRVLAGPPGALANLEGVSAKRKPSAVGQIEPVPSSGVRRNEALARPVPAAAPRAEPRVRERAPAETLDEIEAPTVTIVDLAEGNDSETGAYAPETLEALRAELKPAEAPSEPPAAEPIVRLKEEPEPIEAPVLSTGLQPAAEPAKKRKGGSNGVWFAAALALALGTGGWVAWRSGALVPEPAIDEPAIGAEPLADPALDEPDPAEPEPAEPEPETVATVEPDPDPVEEPPQADSEAPPAPDDVNVFAILEEARAFARDGDYAQSAALSRRVLELSPNNPRAGYRLAVALFRLGHDAEAIEQAERAMSWDPDDPLPVALIGDIHCFYGRFARGAGFYRRALEIDPDFAPAQRELERLRERRGIQ